MQKENLELQNQAKSLLNSDLLTEPTRLALQERFEKIGSNCFFSNDSFQLLTAVCDLLMDQNSGDRMVNIALSIDERLKNKDSDGWRYNSMPPDDIMYKIGLQGIDETASSIYGKKFCALKKEEQMQILSAIQNGDVQSELWNKLNPKLFFEELLAETAEIFFSHPTVQASINYVGMADARLDKAKTE